MRVLSLALAAVLSPVLLGCPDDATPVPDAGVVGGGSGGGGGGGAVDGGGGGSGGAAAVRAALGGLFGSYCEYFVRCGAASSVASCEATAGGSVDALAEYYGNSIDEGRARVAQDLDACAMAIETLSCDQTPNALPACAGFVEGLVAADQPCYQTYECQTGLYCLTAAACPGTCEARVGEGEVPGSWEGCLEGFYLADDGLCRAYVPLNGSCDNSAFPPTRCVEGAFCDGTLCVARRGEGGACTGSQQCGGVYVCLDGVCSLPGALGDSCSGAGECWFEYACLQTQSGMDGTCAQKGAEGGTCYDYDDCETSLSCVGGNLSTGVAGTCISESAVDGPCEYDAHCADGLICLRGRGSVGTCQAPRMIGEACLGSSTCVEGSYCSGSSDPAVCAARIAPDASCTQSDSCVETHFCKFDSATSTSSCQVRKGVGEACLPEDRCVADAFCNEDGVCERYAGVCQDET